MLFRFSVKRLIIGAFQFFGSNLHVILDDSKDLENVKSILTSGGIKIESARPISFSLEDAFIDVVQHKSRRQSAKQVSEKTLEEKHGE